MKIDMIQGNALKQITLFSLPIIIGNFFQQFYQVVDTLIVGKFLGVKALAAIGVVGPIGFALIGFALGISTGFSVIVSQFFGARDAVNVKKSVAMSIMATLVSSIILTILSYILTRPLLYLLSTPPDIIDLAEKYFKVIVYGIIAIMYYNTFSSILRSVGDSTTPLYFLLLSSALNIIGDYLFVVVFKTGVEGAAIATILSQFICAILSGLYVKKKYKEIWPDKEDWAYNKCIVKKLIALGIPSGIHFSMISIGVMVVQASLNGFGSDLVAGYSIGIKLENLFAQSFVGFGVGITTFCGQNKGANQIDRIKKGVRDTMILITIISIVSGIVLYLFSEEFALFFIDKHETLVLQSSITYTQTVSIYFFFLAMIFIYRSASQGLGSGIIPLICALNEILFRIVTLMALKGTFGYKAICLTSPFAWISTGLLSFIFYIYFLKKLSKYKSIKS